MGRCQFVRLEFNFLGCHALALLVTFSVLFIVPTQIYKERVDASKLMKSNLKVVKGMMNKTELDYAAMGILF